MAVSKSFGLALAAKKGDLPPETLSGAAKHLFNTLSQEELETYAGSRRIKPQGNTFSRPHQKRVVRS